jgi:hypothetical protein
MLSVRKISLSLAALAFDQNRRVAARLKAVPSRFAARGRVTSFSSPISSDGDRKK